MANNDIAEKLKNTTDNTLTKLKSMLSLCKKAGQLVSGESNCENAIRARKAKMIFLSHEASKNTKKKFINSSDYYKIPLYVLNTSKEQLGQIIGERQRSVITVIGGDFTKQLSIYANEFEYNGGGTIAKN